MAQYTVGQVVRVSVIITDTAGSAADPSTVTFRFKVAGDVLATTYVYGADAELVRDSAGHYHVDLTLDTAGVAIDYRWESTGNPTAAAEDRLAVKASQFA